MYEGEPSPNINVTVNAGQSKQVIHLFTKPVKRWVVQCDYRSKEPAAHDRDAHVGAYWCPSLGVIRIGAMYYQRLGTLGPVVTESVPRADDEYRSYGPTDLYKAITVAMDAITVWEGLKGSTLSGYHSEEEAWEAWNNQTDEERDTRECASDDVPF